MFFFFDLVSKKKMEEEIRSNLVSRYFSVVESLDSPEELASLSEYVFLKRKVEEVLSTGVNTLTSLEAKKVDMPLLDLWEWSEDTPSGVRVWIRALNREMYDVCKWCEKFPSLFIKPTLRTLCVDSIPAYEYLERLGYTEHPDMLIYNRLERVYLSRTFRVSKTSHMLSCERDCLNIFQEKGPILKDSVLSHGDYIDTAIRNKSYKCLEYLLCGVINSTNFLWRSVGAYGDRDILTFLSRPKIRSVVAVSLRSFLLGAASTDNANVVRDLVRDFPHFLSEGEYLKQIAISMFREGISICSTDTRVICKANCIHRTDPSSESCRYIRKPENVYFHMYGFTHELPEASQPALYMYNHSASCVTVGCSCDKEVLEDDQKLPDEFKQRCESIELLKLCMELYQEYSGKGIPMLSTPGGDIREISLEYIIGNAIEKRILGIYKYVRRLGYSEKNEDHVLRLLQGSRDIEDTSFLKFILEEGYRPVLDASDFRDISSLRKRCANVLLVDGNTPVLRLLDSYGCGISPEYDPKYLSEYLQRTYTAKEFVEYLLERNNSVRCVRTALCNIFRISKENMHIDVLLMSRCPQQEINRCSNFYSCCSECKSYASDLVNTKNGIVLRNILKSSRETPALIGVCKLLLAAGYNPNAGNGKTIRLARSRGFQTIIELLTQ